MEDLAKYVLLFLLPLPFIALATDALGATKGFMIKAVLAVTVISAFLAFVVGGLHQRPNVADLYTYAFLAWPVVLLVGKRLNPLLPARSIWFSVPVMSWYLVNLSMQFYYPTNGGGGGMGAGLALIAGWFYMVMPFALLSGLYVTAQAIAKRAKGEKGTADNPHQPAL